MSLVHTWRHQGLEMDFVNSNEMNGFHTIHCINVKTNLNL